MTDLFIIFPHHFLFLIIHRPAALGNFIDALNASLHRGGSTEAMMIASYSFLIWVKRKEQKTDLASRWSFNQYRVHSKPTKANLVDMCFDAPS